MSQKFTLHKGDSRRTDVLARAHAFLDRLPDSHAWEIEIRRHIKRRTNDQNGALWAVAYPTLERATGQSVNDWHEYMLGEHFGWVDTFIFGKRKLRPARTTTAGFNGEPDILSTVDFASYYNFIQERAAENGIDVPDPDPFWKERSRSAA